MCQIVHVKIQCDCWYSDLNVFPFYTRCSFCWFSGSGTGSRLNTKYVSLKIRGFSGHYLALHSGCLDLAGYWNFGIFQSHHFFSVWTVILFIGKNAVHLFLPTHFLQWHLWNWQSLSQLRLCQGRVHPGRVASSMQAQHTHNHPHSHLWTIYCTVASYPGVHACGVAWGNPCRPRAWENMQTPHRKAQQPWRHSCWTTMLPQKEISSHSKRLRWHFL